MALVLETALRDALANQIDATVNGGTQAGTLVFETSTDTGLATLSLLATAFGTASTGTITLAGVPLSDTSADGGTVAQFSIYDGNSAKLLEGTCDATTTADITISSTSLTTGDTVQLTSFTITVPATG